MMDAVVSVALLVLSKIYGSSNRRSSGKVCGPHIGRTSSW